MIETQETAQSGFVILRPIVRWEHLLDPDARVRFDGLLEELFPKKLAKCDIIEEIDPKEFHVEGNVISVSQHVSHAANVVIMSAKIQDSLNGYSPREFITQKGAVLPPADWRNIDVIKADQLTVNPEGATVFACPKPPSGR